MFIQIDTEIFIVFLSGVSRQFLKVAGIVHRS